MIQTNANTKSIKEAREKERIAKEQALRLKCAEYANEKFGAEKLVQLSNENKGLWFLPVMSAADSEVIEKIAIMRPIDRNVLNYASSKVEDAGIYGFIEQCMRDCFLIGDEEILEDDEYFIPASQAFNKILEGRKAALLKR